MQEALGTRESSDTLLTTSDPVPGLGDETVNCILIVTFAALGASARLEIGQRLSKDGPETGHYMD